MQRNDTPIEPQVLMMISDAMHRSHNWRSTGTPSRQTAGIRHSLQQWKFKHGQHIVGSAVTVNPQELPWQIRGPTTPWKIYSVMGPDDAS